MVDIIGFNFQALGNYFSAGGGVSERVRTESLRAQGITTAAQAAATIVPPWLQSSGNAADDLLQTIFSSKRAIDPDDPMVTRNGGDDTFRQLFTLYRGLTRARELVGFAESDPRAAGLAAPLDKRLQQQLDEIRAYADGLKLDGATVLSGIRDADLASTVRLPKTLAQQSPEHVGATVTTAREDAIPGLTGTESFTISVDRGGSVTGVAIDLSDIAGTLNVDAVVDHVNAALLANGSASRFVVERKNEFAYGFRIQQGSGESLSMSAPPGSGEPALYVAGTSGAGANANGFLRKLDGLDGSAPALAFDVRADTGGEDQLRGVATAADGSVYAVGKASGDVGAYRNGAGGDMVLSKYDAAGTLIWSRLLGGSADTGGFAVAVDAAGDVVVAGRTRAQLTTAAYGGGEDGFVTKFDADGQEKWTRQAQPHADDAVLALATDAAGNIYLAGQARAAMGAGVSHAGAADGFVQVLDADGTQTGLKQFGTAGEDRAAAVQVSAAGDIYVAAEEDGRAVVRKYAAGNATQVPDWTVDLGDLQGGAIGGLALGAGGALYVSGRTANASLAGTIQQGHAGGDDAFVTRIVDQGATASVDWTSHVGSAGDDGAAAVTVNQAPGGDEIYLTGSAGGTLPGAASVGTSDAFVARLDDTGQTQWTHQFGGSFGHAGAGLAFSAEGTSVLSRLGLPAGTFATEPPTAVAALTSARAGQSFTIAVGDGAARRITLEAGDSLGFLAFKMNTVLGSAGRASIEQDADGRYLKIEALGDQRIDIAAGPQGRDLLAPLGLKPATLYPDAAKGDDGLAIDDGIYALGLFDGISVADRRKATDAGVVLDNALRALRKVYSTLTDDGSTDNLRNGLARVSRNDSARIDALSRTLDIVTNLAQNPPNISLSV